MFPLSNSILIKHPVEQRTSALTQYLQQFTLGWFKRLSLLPLSWGLTPSLGWQKTTCAPVWSAVLCSPTHWQWFKVTTRVSTHPAPHSLLLDGGPGQAVPVPAPGSRPWNSWFVLPVVSANYKIIYPFLGWKLPTIWAFCKLAQQIFNHTA